MVTQVTLGNFFTTSTGKTVLGGAGGSGLDTQSLINSLVTAKSAPAVQYQDEIKVNDAQSTALGNFQQLLSTFQSAADALRNPPGVNNDADNVFAFTTGSVSTNGTDYVSLTTAPGAALQSYNISNITSLASTSQQTSSIINVASADTAVVSANPISGTGFQFAPGTITINGQAFTLNEGDTLNNVAAKFNAVSSNTGITATIIQLGSGQYEMSFNSTATGSASNFNLGSSSTVTDPSGVLSNLGFTEQQSTGVFTVASADDSVVPPASGSVAIGAGEFDIGSTPITIATNDSLNTIAGKFNAVSSSTGITAHVVQVASGQFKLTFTANPGAASFDLTTLPDPNSVFTSASIGVSKAGNAMTGGADAQFMLNGIAITRSSNNINDVINGVTFNLLQETPDARTITASVQPDTTTVQNTIVSFVNAYNAIKTFAAQQTQLKSDGTYASTAVLANNQTFRTIMSDVSREVLSQVAGMPVGSDPTHPNPNSLAGLGITVVNQPATSTTPEVDNTLNINDGTLSSALSTNFANVKQLFGFTLTSNNPDLTIYSDTNALAVTSFTLNIDRSTNTFDAVYMSGSTPVTVHMTAQQLTGVPGFTLTGPAGSPLEGLTLIYANNNAATINVTTTQGVADKIYNSSTTALAQTTGTLSVELKSLQDSDTRLNQNITQVNAQVAQYQEQLLNQFAALESSISQVNSLLSSLSANDQARIAAATG